MLAQKEASADLADLSDLGVAEAHHNIVPDTKDSEVVDGEEATSGEDAAIAAVEASRGRLVEDDREFMLGFGRVFDNWDRFFSALTSHNTRTWQLVPRRT
ncbi:hypothetical protein PHYPSEUDO_014427 [Phytophthora pseudosyringae]|uniref:Uncharacterized protein n=1 Tax=Phytophthora pseudosyringae TaxID=221518 RepID=A0A8T1W5B5_9STRA|nr:hypothetical protein PHYPSEUDO_014427 [Phytophthora pseudosyringae]